MRITHLPKYDKNYLFSLNKEYPVRLWGAVRIEGGNV